MTVAGLVAELRARGVALIPDGDLLRCRPKSALTERDLEVLRSQKPQVLAYLRSESTKPCRKLVCYACRSHRFWRSALEGHLTCGTCHPPADEHLVAEWIEHGDTPSGEIR